MSDAGPFTAYAPYKNYTKEDLHEATTKFTDAEHDGLRYMFYPLDLNFLRDYANDMNPLFYLVQTMNRAGYHVHAHAWCVGGVDVWVERMTKKNRWGDTSTNHEYHQTELSVFMEEWSND